MYVCGNLPVINQYIQRPYPGNQSHMWHRNFNVRVNPAKYGERSEGDAIY